MNKIKRNTTFTMIELLFVAVISAMIFTVVIILYIRMMAIKSEMEWKQTLIQSSYNMLERINVLMQNYTIDYEEYYNRSTQNCWWWVWVWFWDVNKDGSWWIWNCTQFTNYGNESSHPFGFYSTGFWIPWTDSIWGTDDDYDNWDFNVAIPDNNSVQELYLISKDKKERLFMRRKFMWNASYTWVDLSKNYKVDRLYGIQILRLRGFDAWKDHDFNSLWMYDGKIDTWACDYSKGFICGGNSVWWAYGNYKLPFNVDDWRVDFFPANLTVSSWNIEINPNKDPALAWNDLNVQINPYIKINLKTKLFAESWFSRMPIKRLENYELDLQTTFNIKTNY